MKKVKVPLEDLIQVLEAMRDTGGTTEVIFFSWKGMPALADALSPENIITFQTTEVTEEEDFDNDDDSDGTVH